MKKSINQNQWNELSIEEKNILAEKMFDMGAFFIGNSDKHKILQSFSNFPDIGMMVEFIGEDWWTILFCCGRFAGMVEKNFDGELCDELWELTKSCLRERHNTKNL